MAASTPNARSYGIDRDLKRDALVLQEPGLDDAAIVQQYVEAAFKRAGPAKGPLQPIDVEALRAEMVRRPRRSTYDFLYPTHNHLLNLALFDALPVEARAGSISAKPKQYSGLGTGNMEDLRFMLPARLQRGSGAPVLPHAHHLVYFPLQRPSSLLLPDGTDPGQSPGPPFVRRMWAGGFLRWKYPQRLQIDGRRIVCIERIDPDTLRVRGALGHERVFVDVWRKYGSMEAEADSQGFDERTFKDLEDQIEKDPALEERRTLVFMRARDDVPEGVDAALEQKKIKGMEDKVVLAKQKPEYSFKLTPTREMLFQFSALTYNTHAIHLDPEYCRKVEGYRDLLVQGPLLLVLMMSALRAKAKMMSEDDPDARPFGPRTIYNIEYRNLAPLYVNEELKVCVSRRSQERLGRRGRYFLWDVWVENHNGSLCAKGSAVTRGKTPKLLEMKEGEDEYDELDEFGSLDEFDRMFMSQDR